MDMLHKLQDTNMALLVHHLLHNTILMSIYS